MRWLLLSMLLVATSAVAQPIDGHATRETRNLFANMQRLAQRGVMFGHQNTLTYGHDWAGDADRSDVKDVTGVYPAVYGWDVMDIFADKTDRLDPAKAARLRAFVAAAHARGGVNTFSWHMPNPVTGTDAWDVSPAVAAILPGGRLHDAYRRRLDIAATFLASLKDAQGRPIPVWFRPFHEQTGAWFWWGRGNASAADFVALWRFTVGYLRDTRRVHNLLYAYSTDIFDGAADYFAFYPGDRWVDMLGFDDYHSIEITRTRDVFARRLAEVTRWAGERGKIAALTETGLEKLPDPQWWTQVLLPGLQAPSSRGVSYVLVWRNANAAREKREHFFAPYRGQASAADFVQFEKSPMTLFEPDLPNLYANPAAR
ncbi:Beta-mannosidase [Sphingomonas sp. EC-HK361]|uniref:glycoside hydrolase family 26 protein n=1 Tax=Sphingomonas sp. EC-HK361 TaxID=2038397 RepID=UPI001256681F|nr:glycosyl hydrolase [Sphingomonas sp. EC-HK361]VVT21984.1 Beta-mannosidase [Sphingomonas sp. EC-HK361]